MPKKSNKKNERRDLLHRALKRWMPLSKQKKRQTNKAT